MVVLEARGLGKDYQGRQVLQCIDLQICEGDVLCLIGPRGAGKTTLLRLLDLLEKPSGGELYFNGVNVTFSERLRLQVRRRMSFVLQKPIVFSGSVRDNIAYGLKWRGEASKLVRKKTEYILELVGIADYADREAKTLSGGEMQLVALARALVTEPEVLFLDEPTANLDPVSGAKIEAILARLIESRKMTIVMATHDMAQGQRLANRIGVLMSGRLLQIGSPVEIFCLPASKKIAEFVGVENILSGSVTEKNGGLATISVGEVTFEVVTSCNVGDLVWAIIRPEDITFARVKELSSARNVFQGKITRMATVGALVRVEVDCGFTLLGVLTKKSADDMGIEPGVDVYASFKASAVHIIKR
jgi:tungstate transport system ATP-binding protein